MPNALLDDPYVYTGASLLLGFACAGVFIGLLRIRAGKWVFLALALTGVACVYALNPTHRIASFHGFYHASIVYQILNGTLPPQDPLMGGAWLSYPWAPHVILAGIVAGTGLSVSWAMVLLNLAALSIALALCYRLTAYFFEDNSPRLLATGMAVFGATLLPERLYTLYVQEYGIALDIHGTIPILRRFSNMNAMPVGVILFVAYAILLLRVLTTEQGNMRTHAALFATVLLCGMLYPFALVALAAFGAGAGLVALSTRTAPMLRRVTAAGISSALGAACALPLPLMYVAGRTSGTSFALTTDIEAFAHKVLQEALILSPLALLLLAQPRTVRDWYRGNPLRVQMVLAACIALILLHLFISGPDTSEAKWRAFAMILAGLFAAPAVHKLMTTKPAIAVAVLGLFFSLGMGDLAWKAARPDIVHEVAHEKGRFLHAAHPDEDAIYTWIAENTPRNAVLVDANINGSVFGRRALYIMMPGRQVHGLLGWTYPPAQWVDEIHGREPAEIQSRRAHSNAILSGAEPEAVKQALDHLAEAPFPVFIISRWPEASARLAAFPERTIQILAAGDLRLFEVRQVLHTPE